MNWHTPTPTASVVARSVHNEQGYQGRELALMYVVHQGRNKPSQQSARVREEREKGRNANVAVRDEADAEKPIEEGCG